MNLNIVTTTSGKVQGYERNGIMQYLGMFKDHYSETVVVVLAIVMGIIMAIAAIIIDGSDFNFGNIFKIWAMVTLVILLVSIFVPYKAWSEALLRKLRITENSFWYKVLDGIIPTLVLNTVITVFVSAANILFNESIPEDIRTMHWICQI